MKKSYITGTLIVVSILTLLVGGTYYYMYTRLLSNSGQAVTLQDEVLKESGEEDTTRTLRVSFQSTSNERALLQSLFVGKDETASIIEKLEGIATLAHVTHELSVDTIPNETLLAQNKEIISIGLKASGTWSEVYRLLALLENLPYKVAITNVRLNHSEQVDPKSGVLPWTANISAQFFKQK